LKLNELGTISAISSAPSGNAYQVTRIMT